MKGFDNMVNEDEIKFKMNEIIKYLKEHGGYEYKLYDALCPEIGGPDSNIVEYAEDVQSMIDKLLSGNIDEDFINEYLE